jgi:hypothetical protein
MSPNGAKLTCWVAVTMSRFRGQSGQDLLNASLSGYDPKRVTFKRAHHSRMQDTTAATDTTEAILPSI